MTYENPLIKNYRIGEVHKYELLKQFTTNSENELYDDILKLLKKYNLTVEELVNTLTYDI